MEFCVCHFIVTLKLPLFRDVNVRPKVHQAISTSSRVVSSAVRAAECK